METMTLRNLAFTRTSAKELAPELLNNGNVDHVGRIGSAFDPLCKVCFYLFMCLCVCHDYI